MLNLEPCDRSAIIYANLPPPLQKLFDIANEKESSTWLSIMPLRSYGCHLHKGAFRDGLCPCYGWDPSRLPEACVCGVPFSVDHALNCPCGGLPSLPHNNLRAITASLFKEVCDNVITEPVLQPLSGETLCPHSAITDDNEGSDIKVAGMVIIIHNIHVHGYAHTPDNITLIFVTSCTQNITCTCTRNITCACTQTTRLQLTSNGSHQSPESPRDHANSCFQNEAPASHRL